MASGPPDQKARWFYAIEDRWQTFSDDDDGALEARWKQLSQEGLLDERRREQKEERMQEQRDRDDDSGITSTRKGPLLRAPPSGVDQVRKGVIEALGKAEQEDQEQSEKGEGKLVVDERLDPDEPEGNRRFKVEVMEDHLFEVDIGNMQLFPVFWKGVLLKVVRATWFYASNKSGGHAPIPYDEGLSEDLDTAYDEVKPWKPSKIEADAKEEAQLYQLPSMDNKGKVHFEDGCTGRIFTQDLTGKLMSLLGGSIVIRGWEETARHAKSQSGFLPQSALPWAGGTEQKEEAEKEAQDSKQTQNKEGAAKVPSKAPASGSSSKEDKQGATQSQGGLLRLWPSSEAVLRPGVNLLRAMGWSKEDANEEGQRAAKQKNTEKSLENEEGDGGQQTDDSIPDDRSDEPPELVLAIHGIGQAMAEEWDAIDFVYDVEKLRNLSKKIAGEAAMRKVSRGKRAQFLPISWRKDLSFDEDEAREGTDNVYTLQDITNEASIPVVRNIISKVILDVPYFLSDHKVKMVNAVKEELNRVYRLFVKRNPHFEERGGRVSLICHSLGSAIAANILSDQPTHVDPLRFQTKAGLKSNKHLFFNVKNLFFIGSPNGFFFHLQGAQLIARRGTTARSRDAAPDATCDEVGRYGCMAAEAVYNCYNTTDPVAFQLSPTVDVHYARTLHPISIPDAVPALLEALALPRLHLSKLFDPVHPFASHAPAYKMETKSRSGRSSRGHSGVNTPKETERGEERSTIVVEQGTIQKQKQVLSRLQQQDSLNQDKKGKGQGGKRDHDPVDLQRLEKGERRFRALNPHGCIDFIYDSGGYNQYFDMLSAHISYWQSKSFATFVLLQLFSDFEKQDEVATIVPSLEVNEGSASEDDERKSGSSGGEGSSSSDGDAADDDEEEDDDDGEQTLLGRLFSAFSPSAIM